MMIALIGTFLMGLLAGLLIAFRLIVHTYKPAVQRKFNISYQGMMNGKQTDIEVDNETITLNHN